MVNAAAMVHGGSMPFAIFDLDLCPPGRMRMPSILGGAVEGGRTLSGIVNTADLTGGGLVTVKYSEIGLGNVQPAAQRYWSQIGGILNPRVRSLNVPLLTDFISPGSFSAALTQDTTVNGVVLQIALTGIRPTDPQLTGGEWFGLQGPNRGARAHVITDMYGGNSNNDGTAHFTVGIAPPLREAYPAGTVVNFTRPLCQMMLAAGSQITSDVEPGWWTTPDVEFIESFGTT
jgi:hypothetical protein